MLVRLILIYLIAQSGDIPVIAVDLNSQTNNIGLHKAKSVFVHIWQLMYYGLGYYLFYDILNGSSMLSECSSSPG